MINLSELNPAQLDAVRYIDGPQLVIAGAGSGKTRVLTYKIAFLIEQGLHPWNILALTFTNKAAREMKERIARQVGDEMAGALWMGTFHSIFARILRIEAKAIGYEPRFTIYDQADSTSLIKTIIKELALDEKAYVPKNVAARISHAKERLMTPAVYRNDRSAQETATRERMPMLANIYEHYQQRLVQSNAMDFDDLLLNTYLLFRDHEDVRQRYVQRFRYVLVDEYQDTNYAQHAIVRQLAADHGHLCVVGDDAQSIYSFRGANIENILTLEQTFPTLRQFKLERNYRSTQTIVNAANSVIAHNRHQYKKEVYSEKEMGEPIQVLATYSDLEEADVVVRRIVALVKKYEYRDMAILYRQNFQSRTFEEALRKVHIPYRIYGGLSFYQRKEIKDIIAYCRVAVNPYDEEALRRIINYPARGIGNTTMTRLAAAAGTVGRSMWEVICDQPGVLDVSAAAKRKLEAFRQMMQQFVDMADSTDAGELMERIVLGSGIYNELRQGTDPDDESRRANVEELLGGVHAYVESRIEEGEPATMQYYLQEVSLLSDLDEDDSEGDNKVTLMTIHSAKGLEFPVVFVVGMEEELFPGDRASESPRSLEEERRLFYVAITRAGDLCYLSNAKMRRKYGQMNFETPSRFITEIDRQWLRGSGNKSLSQRDKVPTQRYLPADEMNYVRDEMNYVADKMNYVAGSISSRGNFDKNAQVLSNGTIVTHQRFGRGIVLAVSGEGMDEKVTVRFDSFGTKQLLTRFAKLTIIS